MKLTSPLKWYVTSTAFYLVPGGIQSVVFPWLIAVYLMESPTRVGIAQMAGPLPMLFLILFGGWLGDRVDQRRLSVWLTYLLMIPPLLLVGIFLFGEVTYELLILWVILAGTIGAFAQPTRDAMLTNVAGPYIQQAVTLVIGVQFGVQILGFAIGSSADMLGPEIVLGCMSFFMLLAAVSTQRLPEMPPSSLTERRRSPLFDIKEGLVVAWRTPEIRGSILLIFGVGLFFASSYMVLLPLFVRDIYDGGARGIALAYAANMLGTVTTIIVIMRMGGIDRPGRVLILGGVVSSLIFSSLYFEMSAWMFYVVIYLWGLCGGLSMTLSRAIVQEASPPTHRARLMSVFTLGIMGGMPIGAAAVGLSIEYLGLRQTVPIAASGMLLLLLYLYLRTSLYEVKRNVISE